MNKVQKKNGCLNFVKGCACFGVLYMHTGYDCLFSSMVACLSRFAVLIFFMVSGYYCYNEDRNVVNQNIPKKIKHILKLCIVASIVYFLYSSIVQPFLDGTITDFILYIKQWCRLKSFIYFIVFNQLPFGGTLWFLFALLYCYLIFMLINRNNWYKGAYTAIPCLIILHIVSRGIIQYFNLIDENVNIVFYRNFIFMGFPFFMLGNYIHRYEKKIVNKFSNEKLMKLICVGMIGSCVERLIVVLELYLGTVIATFCIFVFTIKNPEKKINSLVAVIGEKFSMPIYVLHPIVNSLIHYIKSAVGIGDNIFLAIINPIIVFVTIPLLVILYETVKDKVCKLFKEA